MNYFILYRQANLVRAAKIDGLSACCHYEGRKYGRLKNDLGEFNHLLNENKALTGFDFLHSDVSFKAIWESRLVKETSNVQSLFGGLDVILTNDDPRKLDNDGCLATDSWIYFDGTSDHILVVPEMSEWEGKWPRLWERIAFEICTENVPTMSDTF